MRRIAFLLPLAACVLLVVNCRLVLSQAIDWQPIGPDTSIVLSLATSSAGYLFAGTSHYRDPVMFTYAKGDLFRSSDNGRNWIKIAPDSVTPGPVNLLAITPTDKIFLVGGIKIYRSTDQGENWTRVGFPYYPGNAYTMLEIKSTSLNEIWVAAERSCGWMCGTFGEISLTRDDGKGWLGVNAFNFPKTLAFDSHGWVFLAVWYTNSIFPGGPFYGYVYRSKDGGNSWTAIENGLTNKFVTSFAVNSLDQLFAATSSGVFRSVNHGDDWTQVNTGLTNKNVHCFATNSAGHIFAGTVGGGVFYSIDNGDHWMSITVGLTNLTINTIMCDVKGYLYAGTNRGVFRSVKSTTSVKSTPREIPVSFSLRQNYPNPFNPTTTIEYQVARRSVVSITVYDLTGRKIREVINDEHDPGVYRAHFDATDFSNGIYYYTMKAGSFTETKEMLLAK